MSSFLLPIDAAAATPTTYSTVVATTGPRAHWPLNETTGTNADEILFGSDGTYTNGPVLGNASPVYGSGEYSAEFDGVDDYIATSFVGPTGTAERAVAAWVYRPSGLSPSDNPRILGYGGDNYGSFYGWLSTVAGNDAALLIYFGGANYIVYNDILDADTWVHVVTTFDGTTHKLYKNGVLQTATSTTGAMSGTGGEASADDYSVVIANSSPELYLKLEDTSGPLQDSSGNSRDATIAGAGSYTSGDGKYANSITFDASTYGTISDAAWMDFDEITVEAWVYAGTTYSGLPGNTKYATIASRRGGAYDESFVLYVWEGTNYAFLVNINGTSGGRISLVGPAYTVDNEWHHIVGVYSQSEGIKLYVDGVAVASNSWVSALNKPAHPINIGYDSYNAAYWTDAIDEVVIYNYGLTASDISDRYNLVSVGESNPFYIGKSSSASFASQPFQGRLSNVIIWDKALTQAQITSLYSGALAGWDPADNQNGFTDLSNNNRTATPNSGSQYDQTRGVKKIGNRKVYFEIEVETVGTSTAHTILGVADKDASYGTYWSTTGAPERLMHRTNLQYVYEDGVIDTANNITVATQERLDANTDTMMIMVDGVSDKAYMGSVADYIGWWDNCNPGAGIGEIENDNTGMADYSAYYGTDNSGNSAVITLNEAIADIKYGLPYGCQTVFGENYGIDWASPSWTGNTGWTINGLSLSESSTTYCQVRSVERIYNGSYVEFKLDLADNPEAVGEWAVGFHVGSEPFGADFSLSDAIYLTQNAASGDNIQVWDGRTGTKLYENSSNVGNHIRTTMVIRACYVGGALWFGVGTKVYPNGNNGYEEWANVGLPGSGSAFIAEGIEDALYLFVASNNGAEPISITARVDADYMEYTIPTGFTDQLGKYVSDFHFDPETSIAFNHHQNSSWIEEQSTAYAQAITKGVLRDYGQCEIQLDGYSQGQLVFGVHEDGQALGADYTASSIVYLLEDVTSEIKVYDSIDGTATELLDEVISSTWTTGTVLMLRREGNSLFMGINGVWLNSGAAVKTDLTVDVNIFVGTGNGASSNGCRIIAHADQLFYPLETGCTDLLGNSNSNITWLLHNYEGTDGTYEFHDDADKGCWLKQESNPRIETSVYKFGQSSNYITNYSQGVSRYFPALETSNWTWESWVYPTKAGGNYGSPCWVWLKDNSTSGNSFRLSIGESYITFDRGGTYIQVAASLSAKWSHVAVVHKDDVTYVYLDGTLQDSAQYTNPIYAGQYFIGNSQQAANGNEFQGYLDSTRFCYAAVYDTDFTPDTSALTVISEPVSSNDTWILQQFDGTHGETTFTDDQPGKLGAITTFGSVAKTTTYSKFGTASMDVVDEDDGLIYPTFPAIGTNDITVEGWFRPTADKGYGASTDIRIAWSLNMNGANGMAGSLGYEGVAIRSDGTTDSGVGSLSLNDGSFHHVAWVRKNMVWKIFIDGTAVHTSSAYSDSTNSYDFYVGPGGQPNTPYNFEGQMDSFRVVINQALYWTSSFTPSGSALGVV